MRAIVCTRYGPPEVLQLRDLPKPQPKGSEVLIRIAATTVTASDCIVRAFNMPLRLKLPMGAVLGFRAPRNPILGLVLAGEVESAGKDVTQFKPGNQVYAFTAFRFGAYAEYKCLPEKAILARKPSNLTHDQAAAIPYGGLLALYFLRQANIESRRHVLVYGASGAIGTTAVQLAKHFGADVTGVCSAANVDLVKSLGADTVIDYTKQDFTQNGARYDLIFNAVGKRKAVLRTEGSLTAGGRHITVDDSSPKLRVEDLAFLTDLVESGGLRPVIDRIYPLEQMVDAHRYVDQGHKKGNVVIAVE
ncbi:MAG TPA: NAD(P)-dependent alcohol dehydrogenase [Candidatus Dormibacteraeota bacterium]|nr:NAD(P)-dependent alcohol dehydrogenase [Candidatus Dormibacteraeota bacterium]